MTIKILLTICKNSLNRILHKPFYVTKTTVSMKLYTEKEIKEEVDNPEFQVKIPAFSGRNYPIEYLNSREFELLTYFLFKKEISQGICSGKFDTVRLMNGVSDKGRDLLLQFKNKNTGVIQCKRYEKVYKVKPTIGKRNYKICVACYPR